MLNEKKDINNRTMKKMSIMNRNYALSGIKFTPSLMNISLNEMLKQEGFARRI